MNNSGHYTKLLYSRADSGVSTQIRLKYMPKSDNIGIGTAFLKSFGYSGTSKTNRECKQFLGVHIAEQVLSKVFKNVQRMRYGNPGYDFICNKGYKVDVKSACLNPEGKTWFFGIAKNKIADYFLILTFDNRDDLNPQHIWLIPSHVLNDKSGTSISKSTLNKWKEYEQPLDRVITCCDTLR